MKTSARLLIALAAISFTSQSFAQTIATFDVSGSGSPVVASLAANSSSLNLANTPSLTRTGTVGTAAANSFNSSTWNITNTLNTSNNFISFTVSAANGYSLNLTSLQYAMSGSNTAPRTGQWGYSIDSGATYTLQSSFNSSNSAPTSLTTWDFSDVSITSAQSITFSFFGYGTTSINGGTSAVGGTIRIANITGNDLVLNGTTFLTPAAIPEPSTYAAIFGAVALVGVAIRRRQQAKAALVAKV